MWPASPPDAALTADRTYLRDYAGWVSSIHGGEARALVAAIRQSDDRNLRKALSTRLMQSRVSALLSIGFLYVAVRERFGSSLLQARLRADAASARGALREATLASGCRPTGGFCACPSPLSFGRPTWIQPRRKRVRGFRRAAPGEPRAHQPDRTTGHAAQHAGCRSSQPNHRGVAAPVWG